MRFLTLTSTTGNMASIHFINNYDFTLDFSWAVVNKGPVFQVMTPLYPPLWITNGVTMRPYAQTTIHENPVDFVIAYL